MLSMVMWPRPFCCLRCASCAASYKEEHESFVPKPVDRKNSSESVGMPEDIFSFGCGYFVLKELIVPLGEEA